jgi:hypothetical protein
MIRTAFPSRAPTPLLNGLNSEQFDSKLGTATKYG